MTSVTIRPSTLHPSPSIHPAIHQPTTHLRPSYINSTSKEDDADAPRQVRRGICVEISKSPGRCPVCMRRSGSEPRELQPPGTLPCDDDDDDDVERIPMKSWTCHILSNRARVRNTASAHRALDTNTATCNALNGAKQAQADKQQSGALSGQLTTTRRRSYCEPGSN